MRDEWDALNAMTDDELAAEADALRTELAELRKPAVPTGGHAGDTYHDLVAEPETVGNGSVYAPAFIDVRPDFQDPGTGTPGEKWSLWFAAVAQAQEAADR